MLWAGVFLCVFHFLHTSSFRPEPPGSKVTCLSRSLRPVLRTEYKRAVPVREGPRKAHEGAVLPLLRGHRVIGGQGSRESKRGGAVLQRRQLRVMVLDRS